MTSYKSRKDASSKNNINSALGVMIEDEEEEDNDEFFPRLVVVSLTWDSSRAKCLARKGNRRLSNAQL